mmetsp:Transcript_27005/g.55493  ORF Transcript_27005/g.55493 Transcript_27005/m.55493 type:complete len:386 (-) Transcript_27005:90-1247(-)
MMPSGSSAMVRRDIGIAPGTPGGRSVGSTTPAVVSALSCNLCSKHLATTCFLCACDCVFCEECTYSHFENSCECPTCRRRLGENDFTELVVADANNRTSDIGKASMQSMFTKKSGGGYLQYSELCQSLIRQIDCSKQATKFLLKQLLVETHKESRKNIVAARSFESIQKENTQLRQLNSSQRLQYEHTITDLQNKLKAKESTINEQNKMLQQFRKRAGVSGPFSSNGSTSGPHAIPGSSSGHIDRGRGVEGGGGGQEPPLRGLMAQRAANNVARQNTMNGRRQPFLDGLNQRSNNSTTSGSNFRPFSSSSGGSASSLTPRIRDLSANTGYHFSGVSNQNINKRRRGGTPSSAGVGTPVNAMSPTTAFTLNQGPHGRPHSLFNGRR